MYRYSSGGFAIRYVLPVLWMTSIVHGNSEGSDLECAWIHTDNILNTIVSFS